MDTKGWRAGLLTGMVLSLVATTAQALPRWEAFETCPLRERGAEVQMALLVDYYRRLPERREEEAPESWAVRLQEGLETFKQEVSSRYTEGTLQRILASPAAEGRQAAVAALGLVGTMSSNKVLAERLRDQDPQIRQLAVEALWAIWFRADSEDNNKELQRLMRIRDPEKALAGYQALLKKSPGYAEAYNQRAILYFRLEEYQKSIADCEAVLKINSCHFGAQAGMAQCYMKLKKPKSALKAFRHAFRANPNLEGVEDAIRALETALGEEGKKDDKK